MPFTDSIKELLAREATLEEVRKAALKGGMRPLRLRGAQKVANGLTTPEEVLRVAPPAEH